MILLKNGNIYKPYPAGKKDILIAGSEIIAIKDKIESLEFDNIRVMDCVDSLVLPGLIDSHVHIIGGGGEGGPTTRTPELRLSQLLQGGITTVIGCLGTDGFTRDLKSLLMKAKALRNQGISCWIYTGSYQYPPPTFFDDVATDIALIDEVIGVGELAISDHRSSNPSVPELIRLAKHARIGGMLGGKAGIVNLHMGDAKDPFKPVIKVVEQSELSFKQFIPTHCNRNKWIFGEAKEYGKQGYIDLTASSYEYYPDQEIKVSKAIPALIEAGVPWENITVTSDGCGSLPQFNKEGFLEKLIAAEPSSIFKEMVDLILMENVPIEKALLAFSRNPAKILRLSAKGEIKEGFDADILILDKEYKIKCLISRGVLMVDNYKIVVNENFS